MDEYTPLDLKAFHNAGLVLLGEQGTAPIGPQQFRGLPFLAGTDPQCCFVAFGDGLQNAALSIPIYERAKSVIVAHRLLASGISTGGPVGVPIADYVFTYQNGDEERLTIRDRFEIAEIPTAWGQLPFRAVPDQSDGLPARDAGRAHRHPRWATFSHRRSDPRQRRRISLCALRRTTPQNDYH
jgi:hypothetical protein